MRNGDGILAISAIISAFISFSEELPSSSAGSPAPAPAATEDHGHPVPVVLTSKTLAKPEGAEGAQSWLRGGGGQAAAREDPLCAVAAAPSGLVGRLKLWIRRIR